MVAPSDQWFLRKPYLNKMFKEEDIPIRLSKEPYMMLLSMCS